MAYRLSALAGTPEHPLMREALGDHVFNKYVTAKRLEFDKYRVQVHQWEVDRYLTQY